MSQVTHKTTITTTKPLMRGNRVLKVIVDDPDDVSELHNYFNRIWYNGGESISSSVTFKYRGRMVTITKMDVVDQFIITIGTYRSRLGILPPFEFGRRLLTKLVKQEAQSIRTGGKNVEPF